MDVITIKHAANPGDLISTMAGIRKLCSDTRQSAMIYQQLDVPAHYYPGAEHPTKAGQTPVMMNGTMWSMMTPLLFSQPWISQVGIWEGQDADYDIDQIRAKVFVNLPHGTIQRWPWYVWPEMTADLGEAWIDVQPRVNDKIIVNFTSRYRNDTLSYYFLKKYQDQLLFTGTPEEHRVFCDRWGLSIPYLSVMNFLELAQWLKGCRFFVGNQSFCWNLCEAMKVPRMLETCQWAQNCIPVGKLAYDYFHQEQMEWIFNALITYRS